MPAGGSEALPRDGVEYGPDEIGMGDFTSPIGGARGRSHSRMIDNMDAEMARLNFDGDFSNDLNEKADVLSTQLNVARDFSNKLSEKVQGQARELQELALQLDSAESYNRILEQRVLDFCPEHRLPVTEDDLGTALPAGASQTKSRGNFSPNRSRASERPDTLYERMKSDDRHQPAYIVSTIAQHRRVESNLANANNRLEKQYKEASSKLREYTKLVKDLRAQVEQKDRKVQSTTKHNEKLQSQIAELQANYRSAEEHLNKMETRFMSGDSKGLTLLKQKAILQKNQEHLQIERDSLAESLRGEALANEEQRAYIAVLKDALELKANEMGMVDKGALLEEVADLRQRLKKITSEADSGQESLASVRAERDATRQKLAEVSEQLEDRVKDVRRLDENLGRATHDSEELKKTVQKLEDEKAALLDYVQESVEKTSKLSTTMEDLRVENEKLSEERGSYEARLSTLEVEYTEKLGNLMSRLNSVEGSEKEFGGRCAELESELRSTIKELETAKNDRATAENVASSKSKEMDEMREIQSDLMQTIRELKGELATVKANLQAERDRYSEATSKQSDWRSAAEQSSVRLKMLEQEKNSELQHLRSDKNRLEGEIAKLQSRLDEAAPRASQLSVIQSRLEEALDTVHNREAQLREKDAVVSEQAQTIRFLEGRVEELKNDSSTLQVKQRELSELSYNNGDMAKQVDELKEQISALEKELSVENESMRRKEAALSKVEFEYRERSNTLERNNAVLQQLQDQISALREAEARQEAAHEREVDNLTKQLQAANVDLANARAEQNSLQSDLARLREQASSSGASSEQLQRRSDQLSTEINQLRQTCERYRAESAKEREDKSRAQQEVNRLNGELARLSNILSEKDANLEAVSRMVENFKLQINQMDTEVTGLRTELDQTRAGSSDVRRQYDQQIEDLRLRIQETERNAESQLQEQKLQWERFYNSLKDQSSRELDAANQRVEEQKRKFDALLQQERERYERDANNVRQSAQESIQSAELEMKRQRGECDNKIALLQSDLSTKDRLIQERTRRLDEAESDLSKAKTQLVESSNLCAVQQNDIDSMRADLHQRRSENEELKARADHAERRCETLKQEAAQLQGLLDNRYSQYSEKESSLNFNLENLELANQSLKNQVASVEEEISHLREQLQQSRLNYDAVNRELGDANSQLHKKSQDLASVSARIQQVEGELNRTQNERNSFQAEVSALNNRVTDLEQELNKERSASENLRASMSRDAARAEESGNNMANQIHQLKSEVSDAKNSLKNAQRDLGEMRRENLELSSKASERNSCENKVRLLNEGLQEWLRETTRRSSISRRGSDPQLQTRSGLNLEQQLDEANRRVLEVQRQFESVRQERDQYAEDKAQLGNMMNDTKARSSKELEAIKSELEQASSEATRLATEYDRLVEENNNLHVKKSDLESSLEDLKVIHQREVSSYKSQLNDLGSVISALKAQYSNVKTERDASQQDVRHLRGVLKQGAVNSADMNQLTDLAGVMETLQSQYENLKEQRNVLESEKLALINEKQGLSAELSDARSKCTGLESSLAALTSNREELESRNEQHRVQIEQLMSLKADLEGMHEQYRAESAKMHEELRKEKDTLHKNEMHVQSLQKQLLSKDNELSALESHMRRVEQESKSAGEQAASQIQITSNELMGVRAQLQTALDDKAQLEFKLTSAKLDADARIKDLEQNKSQLSMEAQSLRAQVDMSNARVTSLERDKSDIQGRLRDLGADISAKNIQIGNLENAVSSLENAKDSLAADLHALEEQADIQRQNSERSLTGTTTELQNMMQANSQLEQKILRQRHDIEALERAKHDVEKDRDAALQSMHEERKALVAKIDGLEGKLDEARFEHEKSIEKLTSAKNKLHEEVEATKAMLVEERDNLRDMTSQKEMATRRYEASSESKEQQISDLQKSFDEMASLNREIMKENLRAKVQLERSRAMDGAASTDKGEYSLAVEDIATSAQAERERFDKISEDYKRKMSTLEGIQESFRNMALRPTPSPGPSHMAAEQSLRRRSSGGAGSLLAGSMTPTREDDYARAKQSMLTRVTPEPSMRTMARHGSIGNITGANTGRSRHGSVDSGGEPAVSDHLKEKLRRVHETFASIRQNIIGDE